LGADTFVTGIQAHALIVTTAHAAPAAITTTTTGLVGAAGRWRKRGINGEGQHA